MCILKLGHWKVIEYKRCHTLPLLRIPHVVLLRVEYEVPTHVISCNNKACKLLRTRAHTRNARINCITTKVCRGFFKVRFGLLLTTSEYVHLFPFSFVSSLFTFWLLASLFCLSSFLNYLCVSVFFMYVSLSGQT